MDNQKYTPLKLKAQLCFPLYACSREMIRLYKPYLNELDLTYTQYISMLVLWEKGSITVKELGSVLYLDSGTLTPLLKKLESKGLISRNRSKDDERNLIISITDAGYALRDRALHIPTEMAKCVLLDEEEAITMYRLLYKMLSYSDRANQE
ncbi:MAG: MarR family transcriptional regulator [Ruminococcaceae bacterium]|nr:MarR family transcriptional regulator [Oscillospiraceae bacterium]MBQ3215590.1 MarR family transcriptional regulator [Oscillospiraceae bacterium]